GRILTPGIVQTWIYGILTYQYLTYFASDYRDPIWIRAPMGFLLLLNTTHVAFSIYVVWYYGIANFGNAELLFGELVWAALAAYLAIPLSAFVAQIFLIFSRSYRLLEPYAWRLIPVVFLSLVSLAGCTCGLVFGVKLCMLPSLAVWASLKPWVTTWLTLEMVADCLTAATLARALTTSKASFAGSQRVIKRLFRTAVQTGAFAGAFSVVTMVVFLVYPNTFFAKITAIPIGCVYGVAVMDTLLCRNSLREMLGDVQMGSRATSGGSVSRNTF
ncbi:hypothetical protein BKA70DRAFT_1107923, partial [Coprinopsis sp. MPI-PUGE-AT-0042]